MPRHELITPLPERPFAQKFGFSQKVALLSMAMAVFTAFVISAAFYVILRDVSRERRLANLQALTKVFESRVQEEIREVVRDVRVLAAVPAVHRFVNSGPGNVAAAAEVREEVVETFRLRMKNWSPFAQIRIIGLDAGGRELVRVDRKNGDPYVVPDAELQPKGAPEYFREVMQKAPGEIYLSIIDLRRDNGIVAMPRTPTLRIAAPLFKDDGSVFGLVVINVDVAQTFANLQTAASEEHIIIANADGDYLFHPDHSKEFGFELGRRQLIQEEFPQIAPLLAADRGFGKVVNFGGETSFLQMQKVTYGPPESPRQMWLGLVVSEKSLSVVWNEIQWRVLPISILLTVLSALIGYGLARYITAPLLRLKLAMATMIAHPEDPDLELPLTRTDETAELAKTFTLLRSIIRQRSTALSESEERYRSIIETAVDAIITIDEAGLIFTANRAACLLFGYEHSDLLGKNVKMLMPNPYQTEHDGYLANYIATGQKKIIGVGRRLVGLKKDGTQVPIHLSIGEMTIGGKRMFTGITRDITELKTYEDSLGLKTAQLERSNAELQQFAYAAAHDLQEPLRKIINFSDMLGEECKGKLEGEGARYLGVLQSSATRMRTQIEAILALSQVGRLAPGTTVDCGPLMSHVVEALQVPIQEKSATIKIGPLPKSLLVHPSEFERLFQNLISNALKFSAPDRKPVISVTSESNVNEVRFVVEDNGLGIEAKYRELIFVVFQRLHRREQYPGNGIGLAMCRKIVESYGGRISVDSVPGQGSTFTLTFPKQTLG